MLRTVGRRRIHQRGVQNSDPGDGQVELPASSGPIPGLMGVLQDGTTARIREDRLSAFRRHSDAFWPGPNHRTGSRLAGASSHFHPRGWAQTSRAGRMGTRIQSRSVSGFRLRYQLPAPTRCPSGWLSEGERACTRAISTPCLQRRAGPEEDRSDPSFDHISRYPRLRCTR